MSWWGKVIGGAFGFALGGPIGALLGASIGHTFDKGLSGINADASLGFGSAADQERIQAAFFTATFSIMGRIAKADGQVSKHEIEVAEQTMARMQLDDEQIRTARALFSEGKSEQFDYQSIAQQLRKECGRRKNLLQMFMEIQLSTALADQDLHQEEQRILLDIANILGFQRAQFEKLLAMAAAQQRFGYSQRSPKARLEEAYDVLGLQQNCSDTELKRAYRKLISQHHPDKLVSKGLPEEMMKIATEKTREVKDAYELIKHHRKNS